ncbi:2,3-diaminopropionate biosynthesis protein SbnA [Rhodobacter capsulatus]|uniref:Cysteine synthase A n=1 Tax=Rhodobacter capsulatus TaxID=1061 RepID=A0A1G7PZS4_RHOCA|nr:2,3-diaminopropionate biosynthesis protein SbnA [Rhodobacter capsulatus]WER08750.1 2,3-diaminopropionate biosynthesis protein SbnA [Rhodobacter capsulatus]SDF91723.1 cysteine synthase A [Rhodobacter capsulatus]
MLEIATRALSRDRQTGETGFLWNLISPMQFAEIDFGPDLNVVVKFEGSNPGGSIKLKTALALVANCEAAGRLRPNGHVIESSSGNLGIALAMVCANRGYKFTCVVDPNAAKESLALIRALGGNLVVVSEKDANGGYLGSRIAHIEAALAQDPELVWTNQYANPANPDIHARTTANEILMTYPEVDYLIVGAGTTGTLMGCLSRFREVGHPARIIAVDVVGSVTFGGPSGTRRIPGLGTSRRPPISEAHRPDEVIMVDEAQTILECRRFARHHGVLLGGSSGSVLAGIRTLQHRLPAGALVVTISPDRGDKYVDTIYSDAWVAQHYPGLLARS